MSYHCSSYRCVSLLKVQLLYLRSTVHQISLGELLDFTLCHAPAQHQKICDILLEAARRESEWWKIQEGNDQGSQCIRKLSLGLPGFTPSFSTKARLHPDPISLGQCGEPWTNGRYDVTMSLVFSPSLKLIPASCYMKCISLQPSTTEKRSEADLRKVNILLHLRAMYSTSSSRPT